jgi:hypothetical protein
MLVSCRHGNEPLGSMQQGVLKCAQLCLAERVHTHTRSEINRGSCSNCAA